MFRYRRLTGGVLLLTLLLGAGSAQGDELFTKASGPSPFAPNCNGAPQTGVNYRNAEVEPWIAVNPRNQHNLIGVWQQDRWSNGGANGLLTGVSFDGGKTWRRTAAHFSRCAGGNPTNNGDYERVSDPWVTFGPTGIAYQIGLSFDDSDGNQAVLVSRSSDGGHNWSEPFVLARDTDFDIGLDKEAITADPHNPRYVYAVWDRLTGLLSTDPNDFTGPIWFARTTNGGASWAPARIIYDPGRDAQTISSQIAVLPNGDLVNVFAVFTNTSANITANIAVIRSSDKGATWSQPIIISSLESIGVSDPQTGDPVRTGDIVPDIAVDERNGAVYVVWQDARFSHGQRDGIVFAKSRDGGRSWSAPTQLNKVKRTQAFTAAIDVNDEGVIGVTYYDFRKDTADPNTLITTYWLTTSDDGGRTWNEQRVAAPFDIRTAPEARGLFVGDYEGLAHRGEQFTPFFALTNSGNLNNRTDIFIAVTEADDDRGHEREEVGVRRGNWAQRLKAPRR